MRSSLGWLVERLKDASRLRRPGIEAHASSARATAKRGVDVLTRFHHLAEVRVGNRQADVRGRVARVEADLPPCPERARAPITAATGSG